LTYLDYEGPLSDNRGHVIGWERGKAIWSNADETCMEILLFGNRLTAKLVMEPQNPTGPQGGSLQREVGWTMTAEIWQLHDPEEAS
jgi:hypothetical protein